jgi:hypothetical protein
LRDKKVKVQMVKNSLVKRVFEAQGIKLGDKTWTGTTLIAWGADSIDRRRPSRADGISCGPKPEVQVSWPCDSRRP